MRDVLAAREAGNDRARLAFGIYVHRLVSAISAMLPALGGLDVLVFTAGVGENSAALRAAACEALSFLNVAVDVPRNNSRLMEDAVISSGVSAIQVLVVHTREEYEIARECLRVIARADR